MAALPTMLALALAAAAQTPDFPARAPVRLAACGDLADTNAGAALAPEIVAAFYRAASWSPERATTSVLPDCRLRRVKPLGINSTGEQRKTRNRGAFVSSGDSVIPGGRIHIDPNDPPYLLWAAAWELPLPGSGKTVTIERFPYFEGLFPLSVTRDPAFTDSTVQFIAFYRSPAKELWEVHGAQVDEDGERILMNSTAAAPVQEALSLCLETGCCSNVTERAMPEAEALAMAKATLDAKTAKEELDTLRKLASDNADWSWAACRAVLLAHVLGEPEIALANAEATRFAALLAGAPAQRQEFRKHATAELPAIHGWMADTLAALEGAETRPLVASVGRW